MVQLIKRFILALIVCLLIMPEANAATKKTSGTRRLTGSRSLMTHTNVSKSRGKKAKKSKSSKKDTEAYKPVEWQDGGTYKLQAKNFGPKRTKPVFTGEFTVGLILINFPDRTAKMDPESIKAGLSKIGNVSLKDYYTTYSEGICWPKLVVQPGVYMAPQPYGYYCRHDPNSNRIGWNDEGEGNRRVAELQKAAREKLASIKTDVTCYVHNNAQADLKTVEKYLRKAYPKPVEDTRPGGRTPPDQIYKYRPSVAWSEPLWPNSRVQVFVNSGGSTMAHELGHVLGAPDFYHASEVTDGVGGTPCLPWAYGPTGPAYCRAIYMAFLPPSSYPMLTKSGTYTLDPRNAENGKEKTVGYFIPSAHPNYLFYVEYVTKGTGRIGDGNKEGLLIHIINVTMPLSLYGSPDLCYLYRPDDPYLMGHGKIGNAVFEPGATFGYYSNPTEPSPNQMPAAILPNRMPAGISISNIEIKDKTCSFMLEIEPVRTSPAQLKASLLPKIKLNAVDELLPTSLRAHSTIIYRGEPLKTEYGFVVGNYPKTRPNKTNTFRLFHRDRYDARILNLRPGATYYVRAYVKNKNGMTFSQEEIKVKLPTVKAVDAVPPLLTDKFTGNWSITRYYMLRRAADNAYQGSSAVTALMKLMTYYRAPITGGKVQRGGFDYTQVHTNPSESRPRNRMGPFNSLFHGQAPALASQAQLFNRHFGDHKKWDKNFSKVFNLKSKRGMERIITFSKESTQDIDAYANRIKASLVQSHPVLVIRDSIDMSPRSYALDLVLIDGFDKEGKFHIDFTGGGDRNKKRSTGYYDLKVLLEDTEAAKLIFLK